MTRPPARILLDRFDRHRRAVGRPFDPRTSVRPPSGGRHSWVHYGVMVPGLPAPHHTFGIMAIVGTPGVAVFANDHAITTSARDTAYVVSATGSMTGGAFGTYSVARDCELAADGSRIRFGDDVLIEGVLPTLRVRRFHRDCDVDLELEATDTVTPFVDVVGGLYQHWSVLCRYRGSVGGDAVGGLCTFEYAHGVGVRAPGPLGFLRPPTRLFSYHVLNLDERTQLLLSEVRTLGGVRLLATAHLRGLDDLGSELTDVHLELGETEPRTTPDGRSMPMPRTLRWVARHADGSEALRIDGHCHGDWHYGLGAGFVGSYAFSGQVDGRAVSGTAYAEHVDLR